MLKADGLAAGKGVVVAPDAATAHAAVTAMMRERRFGAAGDRVVIEECLEGPELSFFVLSDGERVVPLGSAQDHKRVYDGDAGPNTGGMGAFAPSPRCDAALERRILDEIVAPVIAGMRAEGHPYRGFLYCGLMLTPSGPKVIEFNVRFGDPEAQVRAAADRGQSDGDARGSRRRRPPPRSHRAASRCVHGRRRPCLGRLSRRVPDRQADRRPRGGRRSAAGDGCSTPAPRLRTMGNSSRPAGA